MSEPKQPMTASAIGLAIALGLVCTVAVAAWWLSPVDDVADNSVAAASEIGALSRIQVMQADLADAEARGKGIKPGQVLFGRPDLRLMGTKPDPEPRHICDTENWPEEGWLVEKTDGDAVYVEGEAWTSRPMSGQGGIASYISKCRHEGREVEIRAIETGDLLAVYNPQRGYRVAN